MYDHYECSDLSLLYSSHFDQKVGFVLLNDLVCEAFARQIDKFMQTPFQKIRRREKERKQRINLSISPNRQNFSLQSSPRQSLCGSLKRSRHQSTKPKPGRKKTVEKVIDRGQYQLVVRDSLRKTSNHRFATPIGKTEEAPTSMEQSGKLAIEGLKCGDDLLKQNRGKLEYMIAQITANATAVLHIDHPLQEICMQKYRAIRSKIEKDQQHRAERRIQSTSLTKRSKFDTREFLICQPVQLETDTVRTPKTIKRSSINATKMNLTYKEPQPIFNFFPEKFSIQSPRRKSISKNCKTQQMSKSSSPTLNPKKGPIINAFNLHQLKGWQSPSQTPDEPLFIVPNFY